MRRFRFKLEALLGLRKVREKEVQTELSKLLNIQNIERTKQVNYQQQIAGEHRKLNEKIQDGMYSYSEAIVFERFVEFANRVIKNAQDKIDSMEPGIQKVRDRLIEVSKERKVIERLKEKKWQEYREELNREEAKENDDLNQSRFVRKMIAEKI